MLSYLQKFNNLPKELRKKVSTREVMEAVSDLEKKFGISLATVIMRVMIKDISIVDLARYFVFEHHLDGKQAERLVDELKNRVFFAVADYLGFMPDRVAGQSVGNWLKSRQEEVAAVSGSSFFFSPDDEEEVKELAKKVHSFVKGEPFKGNIPEKLNAIFKEVEINFGSEELANRFKQILQTYLSGVRDRLDAKQTLQKPLENGGLDFDEKSAEEVMMVTDKIIKKFDEDGAVEGNPTKIKVPEEVTVKKKASQKEILEDLREKGLRDIDYDFANMPNKTKEIKKKNNNKQKADKKKTDVKIATSSPTPSVKQMARHSAQDGKVKLEDVKYVPKLVGPIDELKEMNLVDFRRLGANPVDATAKIKEKIDFLEGDGYDKKLEAIKAWRQSPINKLYLQIGQESIIESKDINTVIYERQKKGKDYLTHEEFVAIMDLNKELRF